MPNITLTKPQKVVLYTALDMFASYAVPLIAIAVSYDIFGGTVTSESYRGVGLLYIFGLMVAGGLIWRIRQIIKLSGKKGWQFALTKSTLPLVEMGMYFLLGAAEGQIDKLQQLLIVFAVSHTIAIYFRYKTGKQFETVVQP